MQPNNNNPNTNNALPSFNVNSIPIYSTARRSSPTATTVPSQQYQPDSQHQVIQTTHEWNSPADYEDAATQLSKLRQVPLPSLPPSHMLNPMIQPQQLMLPMGMSQSTQVSKPAKQKPESNNPDSPPLESGTEIMADPSQGPIKVRTERYIKIIVRGVPLAQNKQLYLSWFLDNNGLPEHCLILIPERHPNCIINFKGINGWIEIETNNCSPPDYAIEFEIKLQHSNISRKNNLQNQPIPLRFYLVDKQQDGSVIPLGEVLLNLVLMSAKCTTRALITHLLKHDPHPHPHPHSHPHSHHHHHQQQQQQPPPMHPQMMRPTQYM